MTRPLSAVEVRTVRAVELPPAPATRAKTSATLPFAPPAVSAEAAVSLANSTPPVPPALLASLLAKAGRFATYVPAEALALLRPDAPRMQFAPENIQVAEVLNTPEFPKASIATAWIAPGWTNALHSLDVAERQVIVSGRGLAEVGGRTFEVGPGDIIEVPAGTPQRITNLGAGELVFDCVCEPRFTVDGYHHLVDAHERPHSQAWVATVARVGTERTKTHQGEVALVTGGNRGIGLATCRALAQQGFTVVLAARDGVRGEHAARRMREEGFDVVSTPLDVTNEQDIARTAAFIGQRYGKLDVLVNNAGANFETHEHKCVDPELLARSLAVNSRGPRALTEALRPLLTKAGAARVINVSTSVPPDLFPAYGASKRELNDWTRELAPELAASGIAASCVSPGWVQTRMGGPNAPDSLNDAIQPIAWLATTSEPQVGGFFRATAEGAPEGSVNIERAPW